MSLNGMCVYVTVSMSKSQQIAINYRRVSIPWFGLVWPGPNYWHSWTGPGPSVAGPYHHY